MSIDPGSGVTAGFVAEARRLRARAEVDRLARARVARQALAAGMPDGSIGLMLGLAQHDGYRLLGQDRRTRPVGQPSPAEVIWRHAAGEVEADMMMTDLLARDDLREDWRQVKDAVEAGRLSEEQYERLAAALRGAPAGSDAGGSRPWLLLDVDGVLNPVAPAPPRFSSYRAADERGRTHTLRLSPAHGEWLNSLSDRFDLAWCTTWHGSPDLDAVIAPAVGLPSGIPRVPVASRDAGEWPYSCSPQAPMVRRWLSGRPAAWLGGGLCHPEADHAVLTDRDDPTDPVIAGSAPASAAFVVHTDGATGLQQEHIEQLDEWARAV